MIPITAQNAIDSFAKLRESSLPIEDRRFSPKKCSSGTSSEYLSTTQTEVSASVSGSEVRQLFLSIGYRRASQKNSGVKRAQVYQSAKRPVSMSRHTIG